MINELSDWDKPPGCSCNTIARARGCENRCDDWLTDKRLQPVMTGRNLVVAAIIAIIFSLALWFAYDLLPHAATGATTMDGRR